MENLVAQLVQLAIAWTAYGPPAALPAVEFVPRHDMPCSCLGYFGYERSIPGYGHVTRIPARLLLREDVDIDTAIGRSILLHELVHALQANAGPASFGTPEWHRREREAYRVQARFLSHSNVHVPSGWRLTLRDD